MLKIELPIDRYLDQISEAAKNNDNIILTAPPGSGKTTRTPPALMKIFKKIIVLVPRRIAALSSAARIAEENDLTLGVEVGYQVRFDNRTTETTRLIFMTEGVFIKKLGDPQLWHNLELIVFDEFHERSSAMDLALGICFEKQILGENIKLMVMSATLNVEKLQSYLKPAVWIDIEDKPFALEIIKSKKAQKLICDQHFMDMLVETLLVATEKSKKDILVFLPGLAEIRFAERQIGARLRNFEINILHGSIKLEEQRRILNPGPRRRIILSTNVAESSITIPSVDCVVDSGLEKNSVAENKIGFKRLEVGRISLFSARQRAGRAARVAPGVCFQLWHDADERSMPAQIIPEIIKSDLLSESLTLISLGVSNPDQFSWLDKPKKTFKEAFSQLAEWNLYEKLQITAKGRAVQSCPLDIERSLLFVELCLQGFQREASRLLAFLETTSFDRLSDLPDLNNLGLTDAGKRIEQQLQRLQMQTFEQTSEFRDALLKVFFQNFPEKIAKRKDRLHALSSRGRGVEITPTLAADPAAYWLLLSGRDTGSALTKCDFAIGFSEEEFASFSSGNVKTIVDIGYDFEKMRLYKIEKKTVGHFIISEAVKVFLDEVRHPAEFRTFFLQNFSDILLRHPHFKKYIVKLEFLKKKTEHDFHFAEAITEKAMEALGESVSTMPEFFALNIFEILLYLTPPELRADLLLLPDSFTLPRGKVVEIDYSSENAPKISARIQELFGQEKNPSVLNGRIRMTIELLAPNYRPTQITSQLENFWTTSYIEIKKELKARYPKHAWPDNPATFTGELYRKK